MVNENSGATFIDEKEQTWDYLSSLIANNNNEKCLPLLGLLYSNKKKHLTKSILLINKILMAVNNNKHLESYLLSIETGSYMETNTFDLFKSVVEQY